MKKVKYVDGDIFVFPLRNNGFGVGLIAHHNKGMIVGYFLNEKFKRIPKTDELNLKFEKKNIIYICIFGQLGLKNEEWKLIGRLDKFKKEDWPIPEFKRSVMFLEETWLGVSYDKELSIDTIERKITKEVAENMPDDGLAGHGFVEIKMTKLLENL